MVVSRALCPFSTVDMSVDDADFLGGKVLVYGTATASYLVAVDNFEVFGDPNVAGRVSR